MSIKECTWCGQEITGGGIKYSKMLFCSDECRDDYQDDVATKGDDLDDLDTGFDGTELDELDFESSDFLDDEMDGQDDGLAARLAQAATQPTGGERQAFRDYLSQRQASDADQVHG